MKVLKITYPNKMETYYVVSNASSFHISDNSILISMPENETYIKIKCESDKKAKESLHKIFDSLLGFNSNYTEVESL